MFEKTRFEERAFIGSLLAVSVLFGMVLKPFWGVVFWAIAIALIFYPVQQGLLRRMQGRPNLVAALTLVLCILSLVLPALMLLTSLIAEGVNLYEAIQAGKFDPAAMVEKIRNAFPAIESLLHRFGISMDVMRGRVTETAVAVGRWAAQHAFETGQNAFELGLNIVLTLYLAFFMLRDGPALVGLLIRAIPLGDARERLLLEKFAEVTRATVKGSLLVALAQGTLGGITFAVLGVQGALLWGAVMVIVSLIPAVGAALIWAPVAIYLCAVGDWGAGLVLVAVGIGVIGMVDNVLRPVLVGRDTKLPDYLVLFSTLGGLNLLGMNGLIIGPLVAALFLAFWEIFMREFNAVDG